MARKYYSPQQDTVAVEQSDGTWKVRNPTKEERLQLQAKDTSPLEAGLVGAGRMFVQAGRSIRDAYDWATGQPIPPRDPFEDNAYHALQNEHPFATGVGEAAPFIAGSVLAPGSGLAGIGSQAAVGGGIGAITAPPGQHLSQGLLDAALMGGGQAIGNAIGGAIGGAVGRITKPGDAIPGDLAEAAAKHQVPIGVTDTKPDSYVSRWVSDTPKVDELRKAQADALQKTRNETLKPDTYPGPGSPPNGIPPPPDSLPASAFSGPINNPELALQDAARRIQEHDWLLKNELYKNAAEIAGDTKHSSDTLVNSLNKTTADVSNGALPDKGLVQTLSDIRSWLETPRTFGELQTLDDRLGGMIADSQRGVGTVVGRDSTRVLAGVKQEIRAHLNNIAAKTPDLKDAWGQADEFYKQRIAPLNDPTNPYVKVLKNPNNADRNLTTYLHGSGDNRYKDLKDYLAGGSDVPNQQYALRSVQQALLNDAMHVSTDAEGKFMPKALAGHLKKNAAYREFFSPEEVNGLQKLSAHLGNVIQGSGHGQIPPAGWELWRTVGGGAAGGFGLGGPVGGLVGAAGGPAIDAAARSVLSKAMAKTVDLADLGRGRITADTMLTRVLKDIRDNSGTVGAIAAPAANQSATPGQMPVSHDVSPEVPAYPGDSSRSGPGPLPQQQPDYETPRPVSQQSEDGGPVLKGKAATDILERIPPTGEFANGYVRKGLGILARYIGSHDYALSPTAIERALLNPQFAYGLRVLGDPSTSGGMMQKVVDILINTLGAKKEGLNGAGMRFDIPMKLQLVGRDKTGDTVIPVAAAVYPNAEKNARPVGNHVDNQMF